MSLTSTRRACSSRGASGAYGRSSGVSSRADSWNTRPRAGQQSSRSGRRHNRCLMRRGWRGNGGRSIAGWWEPAALRRWIPSRAARRRGGNLRSTFSNRAGAETRRCHACAVPRVGQVIPARPTARALAMRSARGQCRGHVLGPARGRVADASPAPVHRGAALFSEWGGLKEAGSLIYCPL